MRFKRDLPACIIRVLMYKYAGHLNRISWAGVMSDYFNALNSMIRAGWLAQFCFVFALMIC